MTLYSHAHDWAVWAGYAGDAEAYAEWFASQDWSDTDLFRSHADVHAEWCKIA